MQNDNYLVINASPHTKSKESVRRIMWAVVIALVPAGAAGVYIFGLRALYVILTCLLSAVVFEAAVQKFTKRKVTVLDGSAVITGLLLAYNLPSGVPLWIAVLGTFFAIVIAKHAFGGLGRNIFNPALAGRAFLMASWPRHMTSWVNPRWWPDAVSSATPLAAAKSGPFTIHHSPFTSPYTDLLLGNRGGCIGEVCVIALLIGAVFLLWRGYIKWYAPFSFIGTAGLLSWAFGGNGFFAGDGLFYMMAGGIVLGAFFMATDMVTTPITRRGMIIFGIGCGILTFCIRKWGGYPEGVSYSILMMNAATPLIDRLTKPKTFGGR